MVYSLTYRRPPQEGNSRASLNSVTYSSEAKQASLDESIRTANSCSLARGIPEALSFDKIISGGTCPPCTLRDFMNYLKYIEHSAENLQFFLWLRDYTQRFQKLKNTDHPFAKEWTVPWSETEYVATKEDTERKKRLQVGADTAALLKGTGLDQPSITISEMDPFNTPSATPPTDDDTSRTRDRMGSAAGSVGWSDSTPGKVSVAETFKQAGLLEPYSLGAFREEINRIITIYISDQGPRQLNLSDRERLAVLHALQRTTHPSAFRGVARSVELTLRKQAHPNFVRWTICNGNRPRVIFARGVGVSAIALGLVIDLILTLSRAGRAWRVFAFILYFIGISTLVAAWKGMCVVLHGMHHRHMRPWEFFTDDESSQVEIGDGKMGFGDRAESKPHKISKLQARIGTSQEEKLSMDSFSSYNSYETEPWVPKYQKKSLVRKVFDRELWIEEPALRQIQDTIFVQSIFCAILGSAVLIAIFVAVPGGRFF